MTTPTTKPAPQIEISHWKPYVKNTLQGFFTLALPSGLIFHDVMLHRKNDSRWIAFPAREWTDAEGQKQYARFIDFRDRATADRFRDQVLEVFDQQHLAEARP